MRREKTNHQSLYETWTGSDIACAHNIRLRRRAQRVDASSRGDRDDIDATTDRAEDTDARRSAHVNDCSRCRRRGGTVSDSVASTFSGGQYTARVLQEDTTFYRARTAGRPFGQFISEDAPVSEIQTRIDKAIPPVWPDGTPAPLDTGYAIQIPAGTTVFEGEVANQGSWYMGGTNQVFIPEPWNIPGAQVVGSWPLR